MVRDSVAGSHHHSICSVSSVLVADDLFTIFPNAEQDNPNNWRQYWKNKWGKNQVKQQEGKSETFKKSIDVQFLIIT